MSETVKDLRMSAYYYDFDSTGCRSVDEILSAIAVAGKAYHRAQCAANSLAAEVEKLRALLRETSPSFSRYVHHLPFDEDADYVREMQSLLARVRAAGSGE